MIIMVKKLLIAIAIVAIIAIAVVATLGCSQGVKRTPDTKMNETEYIVEKTHSFLLKSTYFTEHVNVDTLSVTEIDVEDMGSSKLTGVKYAFLYKDGSTGVSLVMYESYRERADKGVVVAYMGTPEFGTQYDLLHEG